MKTPIVLFVYKRPEHTVKVLREILKVKPEKLYVVADGPKCDDDKLACQQVLKAVDSFVTGTNIEVKKNISLSNLGGPERIPSGLDWVFSMEEEAIILEDDCVPSQSFFQFCSSLLERYKYDDRIGVISGNNFQKEYISQYSYYFSIFNHCWGWATWKRAWRHFDITLKKWPEYRDGRYIEGCFSNKLFSEYWNNIFEKVYNKEKTHWDYAWTFTCWSQGFLSIIPAKNLVSNIGFGLDATNTKNSKDVNANRVAHEINFPLIHPELICRNFTADVYSQKNIFGSRTVFEKMFLSLKDCFELVK